MNYRLYANPRTAQLLIQNASCFVVVIDLSVAGRVLGQ